MNKLQCIFRSSLLTYVMGSVRIKSFKDVVVKCYELLLRTERNFRYKEIGCRIHTDISENFESMLYGGRSEVVVISQIFLPAQISDNMVHRYIGRLMWMWLP